MGDDDHGLAVGLHVAHDLKEPVGLLRGEDGGGLVQYENVRAPVEDLNDLHRLFFGDGHVVDFFVGVDDKTIFVADFIGGYGFQIQLLLAFQSQNDILCRCKDIH